MSERSLFAAMWVAMLSSGLVAGAEGVSSSAATNAAVTNAASAIEAPLTNKAVLVISKLRGVQPAEVKLRPARRTAGPFEIDISNVSDGKHEAEELSKELGTAATVVFEHVSGDGVTRTNWSFRSGAGRKVTAPAAPTGLGPNGKRLYVWPQSSSQFSAPAGVRVRTKDSE
jgi:hypothetical protein